MDLEVAECRAWLALQLPGEKGDFHVKVLGGRWTATHTKWSWDSLQAFARTPGAVEFCQLFRMQQAIQFGRADFTRQQALTLCNQWCARMSTWYNLWIESDYGPELYTPDMAENGHDDLELVTEMLSEGEESAFWIRGQQVRSCNPTRPEAEDGA